MTFAELLALLGRAWPRLLIYPGGFAGLLIAAAILVYQRRSEGNTRDHRPSDGSALTRLEAISAIAVPWLGLALLPLPLAASIDRSIDCVVALALLEWPRLLAATRETRAGSQGRLAALLNSYPPLIAAVLLLAATSGSLDLAVLASGPPDTAQPIARAAHWFGAAALLVALVPLLGLRPFDTPPPSEPQLRLGLALRSAGLSAIAVLPWASLLSEEQLWLLPLPVAGVLGSIWGLDRLGAGQPALRLARTGLWLGAVAAAMLMAVAIEALAGRL
jgi:formate hydrogenlyase subunit 4